MRKKKASRENCPYCGGQARPVGEDEYRCLVCRKRYDPEEHWLWDDELRKVIEDDNGLSPYSAD